MERYNFQLIEKNGSLFLKKIKFTGQKIVQNFTA